MHGLKICFSVADQSFERAKSIGILNVSLGLLGSMAQHPGIEKLAILSTSSLSLRNSNLSKHMITDYDLPARGKIARLMWDQWGVYRAAAKTGCDWLFLPKGFASFVVPPPIKLAAYVHDAMQDFYRSRYPGAVSRGEEFYFDHCVAATLRRASVIFTNSDFSRQEILRMAVKLKIRAPSVVTAGIGFSQPDRAWARKGENYIVALVSKWPHKLSCLTMEYLRHWQEQANYTGEIRLVGPLPEGLAMVDYPKWKHFQRLPESEYVPMLQGAKVLVYFSEYEGFGMPPIEAILQGTPPVYSRIPAMEESSEGCGFLFDNSSEASFQAAMGSALACDVGTVRHWMKLLMRRHNWESVARRVVDGLTNYCDYY